jgi:hypothetical protein
MTNITPIALTLVAATLISSCGEQRPAHVENTDSVAVNPAPAAADTVNAPRLVTQEADSLILSAETGKGVGPAIKYMPEWRAFGWFTSADSVVWDAEVKDAGEYDVFLEWSVSDEEAGKEFVLNTDNYHLAGVVEKSGSWETYKSKNIGSIKLDAGPEKIVFKSKKEFSKEGALLDLSNLKLVKKK